MERCVMMRERGRGRDVHGARRTYSENGTREMMRATTRAATLSRACPRRPSTPPTTRTAKRVRCTGRPGDVARAEPACHRGRVAYRRGEHQHASWRATVQKQVSIPLHMVKERAHVVCRVGVVVNSAEERRGSILADHLGDEVTAARVLIHE